MHFGGDPAVFLLKWPYALQWNTNRLLQGTGGRVQDMHDCLAITVRIHPLCGHLALMNRQSASKSDR